MLDDLPLISASLRFGVKHADAVSLSFVRRPEDVRRLHAALDRLGRKSIGVVLKIETRAGFENLPRLLLEGLRKPPLAVMIARGDLAAEVGFERDQNTPENLRLGRFIVNFQAEEAPVLRYLGIRSARYRPALDILLDDLAAQLDAAV